MATPRKTLGSANAPYIVSLMRLMETQSKATLGDWCIGYAQAHLVPIYEKAYPSDLRPQIALQTARDWFAGSIKLPAARQYILGCHAAAREAEGNPAAQAAARAIGQAASALHSPSHALGIAYYGAAAIAYDRVGPGESPEVYERIAAEVCADMEGTLRAVAVEDEANPARMIWQR